MPDNNPLVQELALQMNLLIPQQAAEVARNVRIAKGAADQLGRSGLARRLKPYLPDALMMCGITTKSVCAPGLGGQLYCAAGLMVKAIMNGSVSEVLGRDSRLDVGALDWLIPEQRLLWRRYHLLYSLLEDILLEKQQPAVIVTDLPLLVTVGDLPVGVQDEDLISEWQQVSGSLRAFWNGPGQGLYPWKSDGPVLVSLSRRNITSLMVAVRRAGQDASPDPLGPEAVLSVQSQWNEHRRTGVSRVIQHLVRPEHRSMAFRYDAVGVDHRCEPKQLVDRGLIGFYYRSSLQAPLWQAEVIGAEDWTTHQLDELARILQGATLINNSSACPLPLMQAQLTLQIPKRLLQFFESAVETEGRKQEEDWQRLVDELGPNESD